MKTAGIHRKCLNKMMWTKFRVKMRQNGRTKGYLVVIELLHVQKERYCVITATKSPQNIIDQYLFL